MTRKYAFVFPGQGSQAIGMGKDLYQGSPTARKVFQEVDDVLQENLSSLMFEGSDDALRLTQNAQPALMTVSMALLSVLAEESDLVSQVEFVAGHSLGEFSALCAAKTFSLKDTALLLKQRGQFMQDACHETPGGMAAVLGLDAPTLQDLLDKGPHSRHCHLANDNCPGQLVISGTESALESVIPYLQSQGAKRVIKLPVSGGFHSPLMTTAQTAMATAFASIKGSNPQIPYISNQTATPMDQYPLIEKALIHQMTGPVRWRETILYMEEKGITDVVEVGSGKVLTNLAMRTAPSMNTFSLNRLEDIYSFLETL